MADKLTETVERVARKAMFGTEVARTHLMQGAGEDYFYVSFAGQRIEFRLDRDPDALRGPYGQEMAALSAKAAECASAINDTLLDVAKAAVLAALSRPNVDEMREALEAIDDAANAYEKFVAARTAMNAARPSIDATPAERALYDERYQADHEAERAHFRTAISLAQHAGAIRAALRGSADNG